VTDGTSHKPTVRRLTPSIIFLLLANLTPIVGVMAFGWNVGSLMLIYWLETLVIGALNIPKMLACHGSFGIKLFLIPFFSFHYGMFCFGHWSFLSEMMGMSDALKDLRWGGPLMWTLLSLFVSHVFSMIINFFGNKEYAGRDISKQMFFPYGRIFIMHMVIIFGSLLVIALGSPIMALILLVALKTLSDLGTHYFEHDDNPHLIFMGER